MASKLPWQQTYKPFAKRDARPLSSPDGGQPQQQDVAVPINYVEVQDEELEVLKAIYMEDYEEVAVKSAWSKTLDRAFRIKIKSFSDDDTWVILTVKLTATYPKTAPLLNYEGLDELHERTRIRVTRIVERRPTEMLGEVMIHAIASEIQEALEDAVQAREQGTLPSLEDERVEREAAAGEEAREHAEARMRREQEARAEEERVLHQMVQEEVERRSTRRPDQIARRKSATLDVSLAADSDLIQFDQVIQIPTSSGTVAIDAVQLMTKVAGPSHSDLFHVKPIQMAGPLLAIRKLFLKATIEDPSGKRHLLALEEELEALKSLRQANLVNVYAFKLDRMDVGATSIAPGWQVVVLCDLANRGTLKEMLEDGQTIPLERARQWSLDLLDALDFLHRHGVIHKLIRCSNIMLSRTSAGVTIPLLSGAAYEYRLQRLRGTLSPSNGSVAIRDPWIAPECLGDLSNFSQKSDIWDFGIVVSQMLLGFATTSRFSSPSQMMGQLQLSDAFEDLLSRLFVREPRNRPSAFDVIPSEFLRGSAPALLTPISTFSKRRPSSSLALSGQKSPLSRRSRHNSSGVMDAPVASRYTSDFTELHRLGKGGFGEVVKARNKVDGGIYAIKKIKQESRSELEQVLSEVMLLHRLNHAYVVRYYTAWVEDDSSGSVEMDQSTTSASEDPTLSDGIEFGLSSRGLDFVSSSGYNQIQFGEDDDEDDGSESADSESNQSGSDDLIQSRRQGSRSHGEAVEDSETDGSPRMSTNRALSHRSIRSTLYIQMEFCERRTLRDLVMRGMHERPEEGWQMLRQILEGLAHIHSHGIIHRDLKPDNIFIDLPGNPRIGDFGLATTSRYQTTSRITSSQNTTGDMTRSVGTALYVAPELQSLSTTNYSDKVDMYSLGIIFFEMCFPLPTAMERLKVLGDIRRKNHRLPHEFQGVAKIVQGEVISSLINHKPAERPSSVELIRSGKLPLQVEDETVRRALQSLGNSGSPYYQKIMTALFSQSQDQRVKEYAWDARDESAMTDAQEQARLRTMTDAQEQARLRTLARSVITTVFRRHGAEETQRATLAPRSSFYTNPNIYQVLDSNGSLLQLPFDLTLPHARLLAKQGSVIAKTYVFGQVFRDSGAGGPPRAYGEVDFDITTADTEDLKIHEAEVIKIVDEIVDETPALASTSICYYLNHSDLLDTILDFCRIEKSQRLTVKESISKLNFHQWTWSKVRSELRSPLLGIPSTSLDDLAQFDFRDTLDKAIATLESLMENSAHAARLFRPTRHLRQVIDIIRSLDVTRKIYLCPLACHNEKFYNGGIIFQCVNDKKSRSVFAAGGRYDSLVEAHRARGQTAPLCHAVGVNIGWDGLIAAMLRYNKYAQSSTYIKKEATEPQPSAWDAKRCEVLIASADPTVLRSTGIRLLATLWAHDISAELATESRSIDDLLGRQRDKSYTWIVVVKHEAASTLKVRNTATESEAEVAATGLVSHIRQELRERDQKSARAGRAPPMLLRGTSHSEQERKANVQVLMSQHRSKKSNKYHIVEQAQQRWIEKVNEWKDAPILAIETRDDVLENIREARLGDPDSWRKVVQGVQLAERQYLGQVHDLLGDMKKKWENGNGQREACVFNFRTGLSIYYDLGL